MATGLYTKGIEGILDDSIALSTDTLKAVMIDNAAYTANLATHQNLSDVTGGIVGTAQTLSSKTFTGGAFDAADISFTGLSSPPTCEAILIYKDTGVAATSRLIAYIDNFTATVSGVTSIAVAWDNGTNRIFKVG